MCKASLIEVDGRCVRCRTELRLGTKILEPYLAAWGAAVGGSGVLAGTGLFMLFLVLRRPLILQRLWGNSPLKAVAVVGVCAAGIGAAIILLTLLLRRRWFCRIARPVQWISASCAVAGAVGAFGVLIWAIR